MTTMTQESLQRIWKKYTPRLENDADPDVVRGDYYEELSGLGGIVVHGRGQLDKGRADAVIDDLRRGGCTVLCDPAREGEDSALVVFLSEKASDETKQDPA